MTPKEKDKLLSGIVIGFTVAVMLLAVVIWMVSIPVPDFTYEQVTTAKPGQSPELNGTCYLYHLYRRVPTRYYDE